MTVARNRKHLTRRIAEQFGRTYQATNRLLTDGAPLWAGRRTQPHPAGINWKPLIGVTVTADDLTGVVLPGTDRNHPDLLRLAILGTDRVVQINPAWFDINPMPGDVHTPPKGTRRKTHCPDGRPIYRPGGIPDGILATQTMLKHLRRRLPTKLQPIASYLGGRGGNSYHPLYAVADCTPMPEQTPKQQAAWTATRTCQWCNTTDTYPYPQTYLHGPRGVDGQRLCGLCAQSAREQNTHAQANAKRANAERHTRALLSNPGTVIAVKTHTSGKRGHDNISTDHSHVTIVDHQGQPIGEHTYRRTWKWEGGSGTAQPHDQATIDICRQIRDTLHGRHIIDASLVGGLYLYDDINHITGAEWGTPERLPQHPDTEWPDGYDPNLGTNVRWITSAARVNPAPLKHPSGQPYPRNWDQLKDQHLYRHVVGGEPPDNQALMWWRILHTIAHGPHPAGPARCPWQGSHKQPPCGSTDLTPSGFCGTHRG